MPALLLISLATLASEDLTCIATGVLIAQGKLGFWAGTAACLLGIYAGDLALFASGRLLGRAALAWTPFRRFVPPAQVERASAWLSARGPQVVFLSRFTPGLRLPTYFVAGLLKTDPARLAAWFLAAAALWTPLLVGLAALFGERSGVVAHLRTGRSSLEFLAIFAAAVAVHSLVKLSCSFRVRRRLVGFLKRKVRWEFWPPWAAYIPVIPYLAYLAWRHRSATLFTASNPGIDSGGLVGESKSRILDHLSRVEGVVPAYTVIPGTLEVYARVRQAHEFLEQTGISYPIALKPDVGERGAGVAIVRSDEELESRLRAAEGDTIIQRYAGGLEFGVFYFRYPGEPKGQIFSITEKRFPELTGDGIHSLADLILRDDRAVCLADAYAKAGKRSPDEVPAAGERVQLVEIGSHCRGAIFLDGSHLQTPALAEAVERISRAHPGFFFGRYDVRTPSIQDFQEGRFQVIELNGVAAEATHIYDPAVSLRAAYGVLFRQWKVAFEIGAINRARGAQPMALRSLLRLICARPSKGVPACVGTIKVVD